MAELNTDIDAGDETRHNGDYIGFPHAVADETARADLSGTGSEPLEGKVLTLDGNGDIAEAESDTGGFTEDVIGVLYTYSYYGDSRHGPFVRGDRDATVKVGGSVVVDFSDADFTPSAGDVLAGGVLTVLTDPNDDDLAAVRVR